MASFDTNQWYQLNVPLFGKQSLVGLGPDANKDAAAVFFQTTNTSSPAQRWQIFPTENNTYVLRTQKSSPDAYLAIRDDTRPNDNNNGSTAIMRKVQVATNEIFWSITPFKNGGYNLVNVANGTAWHLHTGSAGLISMTNNITGEKEDQKFSFTVQGQINDPAFSSIVLPSGATATASTSGSTPSGNNQGGLSTGAKAGIGASIGAVALIALIAGIFFLLRRRRKNHASVEKGPIEDTTQGYKVELDAGQPSYNAEPVPIKYAHQESGGNQIQELEATGQNQTQKSPVELPATQPDSGPRDYR